MRRITRLLLLLHVLMLTTPVARGQSDDVIFQPVESDLTIFFGPPAPGTVWRAPLGESGDWFDPDLWTAEPPTIGTPAFLINGSEARIDAGSARAFSLALADPKGGVSRLSLSGGQLAIANAISLIDGVIRVAGGRLTADRLNLDAVFQRVPDLSSVPLPFDPSGPRFSILLAQNPRFELTGGTVELATGVTVNLGRIEISGGRFETPDLHLDLQGDGGDEDGIRQRGGDVAVDGELKIQDGTYELTGGSLTVNTLAMGDPSDLRDFFFGSRIELTPGFVQTGGSLTVQENLELCIPVIDLGGAPGPSIAIPLELPTITDVTYRLEAGTLDVAGDTIVGSLGVAPARFLQSGGVHRTAGTLRIEGDASRYEITGGELSVGVLEVSVDAFNTGGTLAINSPAAKVTVGDRLTLGALAEVEAAPGAAIRIDGGDVEVFGGADDRLAGLEDLSLLVTGDEPSTLEAFADDLGAVEAGFDENIVWQTLQVGDDQSAGLLRLVDLTDNQPGDAPEAVYVDELIVGAGSTLDLAGLNLYARRTVIAGELITGGGTLIAVPEPAAVGALLFGALLVARRRS